MSQFNPAPIQLRNAVWYHHQHSNQLAFVTDDELNIICGDCGEECNYWFPECDACGNDNEDRRILIDILIQNFNVKESQLQQAYIFDNSHILYFDTDEQCSICLDTFKLGGRVHKTPKCGHSFHTQCIDQWIKQSNSCPLCRQELWKSQLSRE